ncbi:MAG TPA: hypothetical protein H9866_05340 [Candidatus Tidjanibacter gallistercoris]|nr:hypothetical protein [Candidatus Tidjanibacter gallistercoris]
MTTHEKPSYASPTVEVLTIGVESGIASSIGSAGNMNEGGELESWPETM